ncbi:TonB-dependent siderophore receptor [Nitrobacter sp. TKz-YC01]|uniref:TonB-dependent siderophore receptor n=1 Tax=Nitrobacter sp. TKz-YC01 TaxID=3398703 RepID=UPI003A10291F
MMGYAARTFSGKVGISRVLASVLMMSTATIAGVVMTGGDACAQSAAQTSFNVPAGPLGRALTAFGRQAGLQVTYLTSIGTGKTSPGISGPATREQALARILQGTGLSYHFTNASTVAISQPAATGGAGAAPSGAISLDTIDVQGAGNPNSTMSLPPAYAGGQVATGGNLGLLGNRHIMDTPFSQTSYTEKLIRNQQAKTVADVLRNDPSITQQSARGGGFEEFTLRGFGNLTQDRISINGLYGASPIVPMEMVERVEVLKGPNALLNGLPASGNAIGGTVNLVLKRARDEPLTRLTTSYQSRSNLGTHLDVGRRYGENKEFGVRFNGSYRDGETAFSRNKDEAALAGLGLDYQGERVRFSADFSYKKNHIDAVTPLVQVTPGIPIPGAPNASRNISPSWFNRYYEELFGMMQGEVDISQNVTAYMALGARDWKVGGVSGTPTIYNANGDWTATPTSWEEKYKNLTSQMGIRASFDTGPINHALTADVSRATRDYRYAGLSGSLIASNLYVNPMIANPNLPGVIPLRMSDTTASSVGFVDTLSILEKRVQLTVGLRRQRVDRDGFNAAGTTVTSNYDQYAWTPAYALLIKPLENVSVYANYIEGLEQGTTVGATYANAGEIFPPYRTKQYEAGVKVDWGTLTTTVGAFEISRASTLSIPGTPLPTLSVDGEQVNRGVEVNIFGEPVNGLRVLGGVMMLDGRLAKTQDGVNDGRKAPGVPDINVAFGVEWDPSFMPGGTISGRVNHSGKKFFDAANTQIIPSWTRVDLGMRYTLNTGWNDRPLTLRFDVQNAFDQDYWENGLNVLTISAPRTFLLSATMDF